MNKTFECFAFGRDFGKQKFNLKQKIKWRTKAQI